ncbi:type II toxin-antitoxin system RnlA family toxin [Nostoc sp.]|uniref:type II toxin-antitoxin system RnlA family toxin n=1 Tax=Nostoc sp. TaxID=1180 RepID=UPI002FFCEB5D
MPSDFKELNLDRTRLKECVEEFWKINNCQGGIYSKEATTRHRVKYRQDDCDVMVDFILIQNGTTTIHTKIGKYVDKGEQLALYLKDKLVGDHRKAISVSVRNINQDTFNLLLEFLEELKNEDSDVTEISVARISEALTNKSIKVTSKYNDSLTLTHYQSTNTLLIQGKPLYGYYQVSYFLAQFTDLNGFLEIVYKGEETPNTIDVDENTIETELKALLPNAYSNVGEGILTMLRTSYTLKDISIPLPDYSCYVFPALRALEGVMRRLLFNEGYSIEDNNNSFGGIFYGDSRTNYLVRNDFKQEIGNSKICNALEICYTYFVQQRHELFHANDFTDSSKFISTQEQANQIIEKVVKIIDTAYKTAN